MCILINEDEKLLVCNKTGAIKRVSCFDDLVAYISYVKTSRMKHRDVYIRQMLQDAFDGKLVITNMRADIQN